MKLSLKPITAHKKASLQDTVSVSVILIRWIVSYPVDSAIQRLKNRGQNDILQLLPSNCQLTPL